MTATADVTAIVEQAVVRARPALMGRRVVVGVAGGIAAYKAAELVRLLVRAGALVRVVMTEAATEFIGALTLQALSTRPVVQSLFDLHAEATIGHIEVADWAELLVVAPATADVIARLAHGQANDVLTTIALACRAPLLLAPSMNVNMWNHAATRANVTTLLQRGAQSAGPGAGELACGWVGDGRMAEPLEILAAAAGTLGTRSLAGREILVTAGPTHEAIDPVRYIGNRSSGKMGYAVAAEAAARGANVTLVSGPTSLGTPPGVTRIDVTTAAELRDAVLARCDSADVIVMAAAIADERPAQVAPQKLKKNGAPQPLVLEATVDVLAELGQRTYPVRRPTLVGFAAETEKVLEHAEGKRTRKRVDLVVANDVSASDAGFGTDDNRVVLVSAGGAEALPLMTKAQAAVRIWDAVEKLRG